MATTQRRGRAAATTKTVPAKRAPAKKPTAPFEFKTGSTEPDEFDEREPLFSIDGKEYTVLVRVPAHVALEYLFTIQENGAGGGIAFALNYALGSESRRALMTHKGLTEEQLHKIVDIIRGKFDGALADPKGLPSGA